MASWAVGGFPAVAPRAWLAIARAERGAIPEAIAVGQEALRRARSFEHAYNVLQASFGLGWAFIVKGEYEKVVKIGESGVALGREQGFTIYVAGLP